MFLNALILSLLISVVAPGVPDASAQTTRVLYSCKSDLLSGDNYLYLDVYQINKAPSAHLNYSIYQPDRSYSPPIHYKFLRAASKEAEGETKSICTVSPQTNSCIHQGRFDSLDGTLSVDFPSVEVVKYAQTFIANVTVFDAPELGSGKVTVEVECREWY